VRSTSYEAPHYAIFSTLPSLHPSSDQIFSSAPCYQTPLVYVPRLMSKTKFRTHTEPQAICKFNIKLSTHLLGHLTRHFRTWYSFFGTIQNYFSSLYVNPSCLLHGLETVRISWVDTATRLQLNNWETGVQFSASARHFSLFLKSKVVLGSTQPPWAVTDCQPL
jgi:hypothetical protein